MRLVLGALVWITVCLRLAEAQDRPLTIGHTETIWSKVLNEERLINLYIPPDATDTTVFDVAYVLDGGLDEDFLHVAGLYQFYSFEWVNKVRPTLVVGIVNVDRKRDFTFASSEPAERAKYPSSGRSEFFIPFLTQELPAHIRSKYKTSGHTTLIGQSLAGLLATQVLLEQPYSFSRYIMVSPSLWWSDGDLLIKAEKWAMPTGKNLEIYLATGKEGLAPSVKPHVMEVEANRLAEALEKAKQPNCTLLFDYFPEHNHATILHRAVNDALFHLPLPQH